MRGRVRKAVYVGDMVQYRIDADGPELLCEQTTRTASGDGFAVGDQVVVEWNVIDTFVFDRREDLDRPSP